jgi:hypothetical protein
MKTTYYLACLPNGLEPILNKAYRAGAKVSWNKKLQDIHFSRLVSAAEMLDNYDESWFWVNRDRTEVRAFEMSDTWAVVKTRAGDVVKLVNTRW